MTNKENPTNLLIRWAGWIVLALIFSVTGYCTAGDYLSVGSGCEREVRKIAAKCYDQDLSEEADAKCTKSAEVMIQACKDAG